MKVGFLIYKEKTPKGAFLRLDNHFSFNNMFGFVNQFLLYHMCLCLCEFLANWDYHICQST
ncbi:unnamed protein product [Bacillus thuringiensis DB27]|uniref:Uncharacterized protein n=1 Tax=Bacillus thuringiensis DB27 TaxID=1431339 RepID=W8YLN5_BACTU|nr:unnamed protein product [Bacillus thuringiensis DB27]